MSGQSTIEQIKVAGHQLVETVEKLLHEGNVRRIVIKHEHHSIIEFPLTLGVAAAVIAPTIAAVAAIAALLTECTVEVHRTDEAPPAPLDRDITTL